ncbi:hypothetical protein OAU50_04405 [Planctomycetota bacterium]|nr:hypothetical protein [Planctomycetota bacterium]
MSRLIRPKMEPVEASVAYDGDEFEISFNVPPGDERYGLIAIGTDAGLDDHFVRNMEQAHYKAITGSVDPGEGVPLHQIAFTPRSVTTNGDLCRCDSFVPFPGRLNDIDGIVCRMALEGPTEHNMNALKFAKRLPRTNYPLAMWPMGVDSKFKMSGYRFNGGSTITEVVLYLVPLSKALHKSICTRHDYPHWVTRKFTLSPAAGMATEPELLRNRIGDGQSLQVRSIMLSAYNGDDLSLSEQHANAVSLLMRHEGNRRIYNHDADTMRNSRWLAVRDLAAYDMAQELGLVLAPEQALEFHTEHTATVGSKDCHLTLYGQIKHFGLGV